MSWPTPLDYFEAMQNPRASLGDSELQAGHAEEDDWGLPKPRGGTYASVYKVICSSRSWAVRCFVKEFLDQQERYAAISSQLATSKFSFATHFQFLKQGIRVYGNWYPVIKMEWVEGEGFIPYVDSNIQKPQTLRSLGSDIVDIVRVLNRERVAHGDLQHGNILIANGKPKLVDYDGMYVPAFKENWTTHEAGHFNYQLPRDETDFGPGLDSFSAWVIYLSLRALSIRPTLRAQFKCGEECLLFRRKDFESPAQSPLLKELKGIPEINALVTRFESLLSLSPLKIPPIDPDAGSEGPKSKPDSGWIQPHLPAGQYQGIRRPNSAYVRPNVPFARQPTPWPTTMARALPPKPDTPNILASPPKWPGPKGLSPIPAQPPVPSVLHSPPAWQGAKGLPQLPPEPIPVGVLDDSLSYMSMPPMRHTRKAIPVRRSQRVLGGFALGSAGLFLLILPFAAVLAVTIDRRLGPGALVLDSVPLLAAMLFGTLWQRLEWARRKKESHFNRAFEAELTQRRAEFKRRKIEWEAVRDAKLALAQRHYEQEMRVWRTAAASVRAEGQRQFKKWHEGIVARQAEAQGRYDQEMQRWRSLVEAREIEAKRQEAEWEAEMKATLQRARQEHEAALRSWQSALSAMQNEKARRERAAVDAKRKADDAEQNWTAVANRFVNEYETQATCLHRLKGDIDRVEKRRESEYKQILASARERQFEIHLRQELIETAAISGIRGGRKKTLQMNGVRTAWDVDEDRILRIHGFGPVRTANLIEWRRNVEAAFVFKTSLAIPPQEKQAFESRYEQDRQLIKRQIVAGETKLRAVSQEAERQSVLLTQQIIALLAQLRQAEADMTVIPKGL
jgi:hypothetical protein